MKMPCHSCTISQRLKLLNFFVFSFLLLMAGAYSWQILSLERRIKTMEHFEDLVQDVLELRRYEKDLILGIGSRNLETIKFYLQRVGLDIQSVEKDLMRIGGKEEFATFLRAYKSYKVRLKAYRAGRVGEESLRESGKIMADFVTRVLKKKREIIRKSLGTILYVFTIVPALCVILVFAAVFFQTRSVLNRLSFVRKATKDVMKGEFRPIEDHAMVKDEIYDLIQSFNRMVHELDARTKELIQSEKLAAVGTFSSGIAHELNNPLNNISLSADMLLEEYDDMDPEEAKEILRDILAQTDRAGEIVRNLLDFSRKKDPTLQAINVRRLIEETEKLIDNELRLKAIHFDSCIAKELPPIKGDFQKLQQVFLNLFVNAVHAMPEGGLIYVDARRTPDGYIRIDVSDTGSGIPEEQLKSIFDPFFTTKEVGKGTGLGLSIVYGIVKKFGGYVEVTSKVKAGTTFSVFLPIAQEESCKE